MKHVKARRVQTDYPKLCYNSAIRWIFCIQTIPVTSWAEEIIVHLRQMEIHKYFFLFNSHDYTFFTWVLTATKLSHLC